MWLQCEIVEDYANGHTIDNAVVKQDSSRILVAIFPNLRAAPEREHGQPHKVNNMEKVTIESWVEPSVAIP